MKSIVDSRGLFLTWHNHTYPGKTVTLPLSETEIKKFFVSCARAGFSYTRLTNNILRGICMWLSILPNRPSKRDYSKMALPEKGSFVRQRAMWKGRDFHKLQYMKGKEILSI